MTPSVPGAAPVPTEECDLVMKGGITSGIVYPPLIGKLKDRYRFRAIGGTSAGAIAAAGAAAAELGRATGGFDKLAGMQQALAHGTFLRDLFQPSARVAPLMNLALQAMARRAHGGSRASFALWLLWSALRQPWPQLGSGAARTGGLVGLGLAALLVLLPAVAWQLTGGHLTALGLVFSLALLGWPLSRLGAVLGALLDLATKDLPGNHFGLCTGRADAGATQGGAPAAVLTDWLNDRFNDMAGLAGRDKPLTFGDLAGGVDGKGISLRMFTSNLSQYQPYVLPFETHLFVFNEAEFRRFFPDSVVKAMTDAAAGDARNSRFALPPGYCFFPEAADLPVIVATRMSLSFPVLLSAIPLYTLHPAKVQMAGEGAVPVAEGDLQRNWFSDGGICSNFPIQFFDGWLPGRPTFGVNLTSVAPESKPLGQGQLNPGNVAIVGDPAAHTGAQHGPVLDDIYLPKPDDLPVTQWENLDGNLVRFLSSIFTTAQVYRDNDLAMLPSYRERVVQVRLRPDEGGLNLAMSEETIKGVIHKGERAGEALLRDFDFDQHFWVRFRVLTKQVEAGLAQMRTRLHGRGQYPIPGEIAGYPFLPNHGESLARWCAEAQERLAHLDIVLQQWEQSRPANLFAMEKLPMPEAVLRVGPKV